MSKSRIKVASIANRLPPNTLSGGSRNEHGDNVDESGNIDMSENTKTANHSDKGKEDKKSVGRPR
jgi:hypothetical protein